MIKGLGVSSGTMLLDEFRINSIRVPEIRCLIYNIEYEKPNQFIDVLNYSTSQSITDGLGKFMN